MIISVLNVMGHGIGGIARIIPSILKYENYDNTKIMEFYKRDTVLFSNNINIIANRQMVARFTFTIS